MISTQTWPVFLLALASVSALAADARAPDRLQQRIVSVHVENHQRTADHSLVAGLAVPNDIGVLQEIRAAVRESMLSDPGRVTRQDYEDHLGRLGQTWVHVEDSKILGFSAATIASASIWALFIDPAHEGRGIGRGLLDSAIAWLTAAVSRAARK